MIKNKLMAILPLATMLMPMTTMAVVSETQGVEHTEAEEGTTRPTEVLYSQSSTFSVTIPKTIVLDGETKDSDYNVTVSGDISSDKKVVVAPQDAINDVEGINFLMEDQATVAKKKESVVTNVTQEVVDWSSNDVSASTVKTGNVLAETISSGSWKGTFQFSIALADADAV